ncbi:MAG TPA: diphosphomevalonate decarboxylase [Kofleriaceae bacterium]|nr:diphosphomevalonate decarboxylase [Kofleriaceae bacterium]
MIVRARACANIALVKYWGKRDSALNLPAAGSLSVTLAALVTETTVEFDRALGRDEVSLIPNAPGARPFADTDPRVSAFLDVVRARAGISAFARVHSLNRFPTASGLASSASGFAALALAASRAAGLALSPRELSVLARRGSGSAARSVFGGFVRMHAGTRVDGSDAFAEPIASPLAARLRVVIAIVGGGAHKPFGSRDAMAHTAETSPLYRDWLALVPRDLAAAEAALATGDLAALGAIAEGNALAMHATAIAARPAIVYWQPPTLALLAAVRALRDAGRAAYATIDAGPHVKVVTSAEDAAPVAAALRAIDGVTAVAVSELGPGAEVIA